MLDWGSAAAFAGVALAFVGFVAERTKLAADVDIEFSPLEMTGAGAGDVVVVVSNFGSQPLAITRAELRVWLGNGDDARPAGGGMGDPCEPGLRRRLDGAPPDGWIDFANYIGDRVIAFPGGAARLGKPIVFPADAEVVDFRATVDYQVQLGWVFRVILYASLNWPRENDFRRGVLNHQVRRTFTVPAAKTPVRREAVGHGASGV